MFAPDLTTANETRVRVKPTHVFDFPRITKISEPATNEKERLILGRNSDLDKAFEDWLTGVLSGLKVLYEIQDEKALYQYIIQNPGLLQVFLEARGVLLQYFPNSELELAIVKSDEWGEQSAFIYIHTDMPVDIALEQLDMVDDAWYLDAAHRSGNTFNVNLRFR